MLSNFFILITFYLFSFLAPEQPAFKGGQRSLTSFIANNLIYPEYSRQNCLQGTITISFKLTKKGRVFDSQVTSGYGIDLDDEALRIIRLSSGKWTVPASHDTTDNLVLPISFSLKAAECDGNAPDVKQKAIAAYKAQQNLSLAIFNFYDNKAKGKYDPAEEGRIIMLKSQLGYDEKYINQLLRQANRKLKQGDSESACDDYHMISRLGSSKADEQIERNCH